MDTVSLLSRLVAFKTVTGESNLSLIDFVSQYLEAYGARVQSIAQTDDRRNLLATFGPSEDGGILLGGHTDVVPPQAEGWTGDPFVLREEEDRLIGRGTADMKGFLACLLAVVPTIATRTLRRPIHVLFSSDEERGCLGIPYVTAELAVHGPRPAWALIGEPSGMRLVTAHKGKATYSVTVSGRSGHSRNPDAGRNAVEVAAELISFLRSLRGELRGAGSSDSAYEYPWSSVHVGPIMGGETVNTIPGVCRFEFEVRTLPGESVDSLFERIQMHAECLAVEASGDAPGSVRIEFDPLATYPGASVAPDAPAVTELQGLLNRPTLDKASYGAEAGVVQRDLGIDCVICGPGDIAQAHQPDEFVTRQDLVACERFLIALLAAQRL